MDWRYTRRYAGPVRAVILDWAGTAVDHGCMGPVEIFVNVFKEVGVQITPRAARVAMGLHQREHLRQLCADPSVAASWRAARGADPTSDDVDALHLRAVALQRSCLLDYADPIAGVPEVVGALRDRGIRIGSTTSYSRDLLDLLARASATLGYAPDAAISASEVPAGRPAPFMIFEVLKQLGVWPVQSCVRVGDTPMDIEAGLNAGVWTVGVSLTGNELGMTADELTTVDLAELDDLRRGAQQRLLQAGAHYVVDSVAELLPVIKLIQERLRHGETP